MIFRICVPSIEAFVHCERALAVTMKQFTSESLEIGLSKHCCLFCIMFLREYSAKTGGGGISLSASHGKTYQNWLFPLEESHSIYQKMEDLARDDFKSLLIDLDGRRTLDSHAASSNDNKDDDDDDRKTLRKTIMAMK